MSSSVAGLQIFFWSSSETLQNKSIIRNSSHWVVGRSSVKIQSIEGIIARGAEKSQRGNSMRESTKTFLPSTSEYFLLVQFWVVRKNFTIFRSTHTDVISIYLTVFRTQYVIQSLHTDARLVGAVHTSRPKEKHNPMKDFLLKSKEGDAQRIGQVIQFSACFALSASTAVRWLVGFQPVFKSLSDREILFKVFSNLCLWGFQVPLGDPQNRTELCCNRGNTDASPLSVHSIYWFVSYFETGFKETLLRFLKVIRVEFSMDRSTEEIIESYRLTLLRSTPN